MANFSLSKSLYEGTGLGLPLTKALVELQGGQLILSSQPGVGTKVIVALPSRLEDGNISLEKLQVRAVI